MSSAAPLATPTKSPKRRARSQKKTGPTVSDLLVRILAESTQRGGVSLPVMKKGLKAAEYDVEKNRARILIALRRLVTNKVLIQTKGTGASGSFKLNKNPPTPRKKKVLKKKKPRAKKVKRASPKKAAGGATPAAKKSPKKKKKSKAKSPKKVKRPTATKKPKKTKSPKKAKRTVARPTRTRTAAKK